MAFLLQVTVLDRVSLFGAKPDLVLIGVVFFALFLGEGAGLECGLVAGILEDIFALDFFGINTFILSLVGFLMGVMNTKFVKESPAAQFLLIFSSAIFSASCHFVLVSRFSKGLDLGFSEYFLWCVIPGAIYTGLIGIPIISKLIDIYKFKEMEEFL